MLRSPQIRAKPGRGFTCNAAQYQIETLAMSDTVPPGKKSLLRFLPIALIALSLALALLFRVHERLSLDALYAQAQSLDAFVTANLWAALALYVLIYLAAVTISLPGAGILTISGGFLFGAWLGGGAAWLGATIGATLIFMAARTAFGDALRAKAGTWLQRLAAGFRDSAFSYLLVLRLTPVAPFWIVNVAPAFFDVKLRDYLLATALGIIPGTFVYAAVGAGLKQALATGATATPREAAAAIFSSPAVYWPVIGLIVLALIPIGIRALRGRRAENAA
jgi:uncharacterized membrane protein YdjX (TVP38/TMEM64 family)